MGAYHNALREEGSRASLMKALEKAWSETERLRLVTTPLVTKMRALFDSKEFDAVFNLARIHGQDYRGPTVPREVLEAVEAALANGDNPVTEVLKAAREDAYTFKGYPKYGCERIIKALNSLDGNG